jgi:FtsP/CotA-like multicopper oxidase with cupredoxin domain
MTQCEALNWPFELKCCLSVLVCAAVMSAPAVGNSKCSSQQRPEITVKPGSTTRVRLVNAATLVYMTVCFEKHNVTVVALDAAPVEPKTFSECVDVNTGQR